jgi:hypothetical protein
MLEFVVKLAWLIIPEPPVVLVEMANACGTVVTAATAVPYTNHVPVVNVTRALEFVAKEPAPPATDLVMNG